MAVTRRAIFVAFGLSRSGHPGWNGAAVVYENTSAGLQLTEELCMANPSDLKQSHPNVQQPQQIQPEKGRAKRSRAFFPAKPLNKTPSVGLITKDGPAGRALCRSTAMRLPTAFSLDITKFPLTLAGGLRMQFADVACAPIPQGLAALLHRLADDGAEHSGERGNGTSPTETSSGIACGG